MVGPLVDPQGAGAEKATTVPQYMLAYMEDLIGVELNYVTTVEASLLRGAHSLQYLRLPAMNSDFNTYSLTEVRALLELNCPLAQNIKTYSFTQMKVLETVILTSLATIGNNSFSGDDDNGYLNNNTALKFLYLPSCTVIGGSSVTRFDGMTAVRLGAFGSGDFIGNQAFRYCSVLDTVIMDKATAVPSLSGALAFADTPIRNSAGYVYVPDSLLTAWQAASNWSAISAQIKGIGTIPSWSAGTYNKPTVVKHGGHYYRCNTDGTTGEPGVDTTNWQDLGAV